MLSNQLIFIVFFGLPYINLAQSLNIKTGINTIEYSTADFENFKITMESLKMGSIQKVRILHIGDSHIQPDNLTGTTRKYFQEEYGNGGRGLVFPYSLAKTNGPKDYTAASTSTWINSWIINYPHKFKIGLPGIGIQSTPLSGNLQINLVKDSLKNPYTKGFVLYSQQPGNNGSITINNKFTKNNLGLPFDTLNFSSSSEQTLLSLNFKESPIIFHCAYFENNLPGVIYNSAGVAGARYKDFLNNDFFSEQLNYFQPDLLIISLGTNESFDPNYSEVEFQKVLDSMFTSIKNKLPETAVLITCPSENYRYRNGVLSRNLNIPSVTKVLRLNAQKYGFAIWDMSIVMGGEGSMLDWKKAGLVNKDHIHFLRKGYNLQGQLLFEAINEFVLK